jgi:hypothetical protein
MFLHFYAFIFRQVRETGINLAKKEAVTYFVRGHDVQNMQSSFWDETRLFLDEGGVYGTRKGCSRLLEAVFSGCVFKLGRSQGIDSKESIPPAYSTRNSKQCVVVKNQELLFN